MSATCEHHLYKHKYTHSPEKLLAGSYELYTDQGPREVCAWERELDPEDLGSNPGPRAAAWAHRLGSGRPTPLPGIAGWAGTEDPWGGGLAGTGVPDGGLSPLPLPPAGEVSFLCFI